MVVGIAGLSDRGEDELVDTMYRDTLEACVNLDLESEQVSPGVCEVDSQELIIPVRMAPLVYPP